MPIIASIQIDSNFGAAFEGYVIAELQKRLKFVSGKIRRAMQDRIQSVVRNALMGSPEYTSLLGGKLQAHLGVTEPASRITAIIEQWVGNISVETKVGGSKNLFRIEIGVLQDDYADVLALKEASYEYEKGVIPWLEWLLLEGDKRIVRKYEFSPTRRGSRTGLGIMVNKSRGGWQVPAEFSGTQSNNFATRALDKIDIDIDKIAENIMKEML